MRKTIWVLDDAKATLLIQQGVSISEVARQCGVSRWTIYKAIEKGRIPAPATARLGASPLERNGTPDPACRVKPSPPQG
jgi:excisionase family DNA binding protein